MSDTVKMTAPNGTVVEVSPLRADVLKTRGYVEAKAPAPPKK